VGLLRRQLPSQVYHLLLGLHFSGRIWFRWQLQNRDLLALTQPCQEHDLTIRKFQRIVKRGNPVLVDLSKNRCRNWRQDEN
jgi:hypothetical protein